MDKLKIGREEAEKIKNTHGFKSTEANKKTLSVLQEAVSRILSETKSAIEYYEENFGENINEIILTGGSSLIPKIDEYFSANIEKEVYVGDPIVKIKSEGVFKKTESSVLFSNVIGLSLRAISDKSDGINLLNNLDDRASRRGEKIRKFMTRPRKKEEKKSNKNPVFLGKNVIIVVLFVASVILLGFVVSRYIFIGNSSGNNEKSDILPTEEEFNTSDDSGRIEEDVTTVIPAIEYVIIQDTPTGWLNVRNGPGTSFSKISRVNPGEKYEFTDESNNWFKIVIPEDTENDADEIIGWISSEYAKIQ